MNIITLITWGAALGSALIAGVFFAFSTFIMAALARLPPAQAIAAMQAINVTVLNPWFLGVFVGTAIGCVALAISSLMHWGEPGATACLVGSLLYLVGSFAVTRVFSIPRNDALAAIVPESAGAAEFWARYLAEWLVYNHIRTAASLAAAASFILALLRVRPPSSLLVAGLLALLGVNGCSFDTLHPLPPPGSLEPPAERLSQLGLFEAPLAEQRPRAGLVPYEVNASLDADGAVKRRFIWLPRGARLHATADRWDIPTGAYLVKTFSFPIDVRRPALGERMIETRFLVKTADGFLESTYLWNDQQTDAVVARGNIDVPVSWIDETGQSRRQNYHVPGTSQCASCHEGRALGIRSRQLDHPGRLPGGRARSDYALCGAGHHRRNAAASRRAGQSCRSCFARATSAQLPRRALRSLSRPRGERREYPCALGPRAHLGNRAS